MAKVYVKLPPLDVEPALAEALENHSRLLGVPKARIRRQILWKFFEPYINDPGLATRLEEARAAQAALEAVNRMGDKE